MSGRYAVTYSKAHEAEHEIGRFQFWAQAVQAALEAGAVPPCKTTERETVCDVVGHEGDDDYAIWIELFDDGDAR